MNSLYFFDFIENLREQKKSKNTILCYSSDVKDFISTSRIISADNIKQTHLDNYKVFLENRKIVPKTIARKLRSVISYINFLKGQGKLENVTVSKIDVPKAISSDKNFITKAEFEKILNKSRENKKIYTALAILYYTGILLSELTNLKNIDFDFDLRFLIIGTRKVPLSDRVYFIAKDFILESKSEKKEFYLFRTAHGTKIIDRNMRTYLSRAIKNAGVSATVNDIRNSFIINQLKAGNSVKFVSKVAGHSSTQSTKKYLKYVKNYEDKGINRIIEI
ncbi:tyrosine-type recombinase/integrase [Candidatus Dojkabacteria bacterium]|uniref:Tyrosine-type recombinase/integrase n=1 Tax=Candidatus Dojkabacteria bacterium TaxID=2099670 RepID=A0A955RM15_9BACT|nr:tyrosine-type recombinase/integrase [Candidatus Dojkabacteria bacterium]